MLHLIRRTKAGRRPRTIALAIVGTGLVAVLITTLGPSSDELTAVKPDDIAFLGTFRGRPLAWDACNAITWTFNRGGASQQISDATHEAVATMAATSGFDFAFVGYTDSLHPQGTRAEPLAADVHVEIVADQQSDVLAMGDWGATDLRHEAGAITGAVVALNSDGLGYHGTDPGRGSWHSLVVHELGHVLGLGHSPDSNDLMHADWSNTPGVLSSRDIAGLRILRGQSSC